MPILGSVEILNCGYISDLVLNIEREFSTAFEKYLS
jgi:hypothetical protein